MGKFHSAWFKHSLFLHRNWKASFPTWTAGERSQRGDMRQEEKNRHYPYALVSKWIMVGTSQVIF